MVLCEVAQSGAQHTIDPKAHLWPDVNDAHHKHPGVVRAPVGQQKHQLEVRTVGLGTAVCIGIVRVKLEQHYVDHMENCHCIASFVLHHITWDTLVLAAVKAPLQLMETILQG